MCSSWLSKIILFEIVRLGLSYIPSISTPLLVLQPTVSAVDLTVVIYAHNSIRYQRSHACAPITLADLSFDVCNAPSMCEFYYCQKDLIRYFIPHCII